MYARQLYSFFFFFNDPATTEIYTLSLHDALPICRPSCAICACRGPCLRFSSAARSGSRAPASRPSCATRWPTPTCSGCPRSEDHTSELQSQSNLVCRLLLEKKKKQVISTLVEA